MSIASVKPSEEQKPVERVTRRVFGVRRLVRIFLIALPFLLFTAAILTSLVFWFTSMALLGRIAVLLVIAAGVSCFLAAALVQN